MEVQVQPAGRLLDNDDHAAGPDMAIVLVCWNNKAYLEPCLRSLYDGGLDSRFEVVVVDNGSSDGSQAMLAEKFPEVALIQNEGNVGLGRANNQGITATNGRYVLLLNNDTLVNAASLDAMVKFLDENESAGAVGGKLLNPDGSFQVGFRTYPSLWSEWLTVTRIGHLFNPTFPSPYDCKEVREVDWIGSACLLLRREALKSVGLFDESYFIYSDETDLCFRLTQAGWKVYYLPNVITIHYGGRSMDRWRRRKMIYRGKLLFFLKNYGPIRTVILRAMFAIVSLAKMAVWTAASVLPRWRDRARQELRSNLDIVEISWRLE